MIKKDYLVYVHNLRGLAILIIVAIHTRMAWFGGDQSQLNKYLSIFLDNGTIIFVFISGFLFHHVFIPKFQYRKYIGDKSKYVLLPYVLVSIIPIVDKLFIDDNVPWLTANLESLGSFGLSLFMLISGKDFGPYWFIPMITIYYFMAPLLIKLNTRVFYVYIFPLLFIVGLLTYQFGYYSTILNSFIYYFPIYLLGMLVSRYKTLLFKFQNFVLPTLVVLYLVFTILEMKGIFYSPKLVSFTNTELLYFVFNTAKLRFALLAVILLILFRRLEFIKFTFLQLLANYSFGIYFIHLYFIILAQKVLLFYQIEISRDLVTFLIFTAYAVFSSLLFVWCVKLIFRSKSRLLIGS